jgi:cytidine deaminase
MMLALYGLPGAGKSSFSRLVAAEFDAAGVAAVQVRLAAPLYELQAIIHAMAGRPLLDPRRQDGALLNDLGSHLRRINPAALTDMFARRVRQARCDHPGAALICDDMRAADTEAVLGLGFALVQVRAPESLRQSRKQARGDLSAGRDDHDTEAPAQCSPHYVVDNDGDMAQLQARATSLVRTVLP